MTIDKENQLNIAFVKVAGTLEAARKEGISTDNPKLLSLMKGIVGNDKEVRNHISVLWADYDNEVNATILSNG